MAMRGWRRIGIIVSVIWFFGFGVFLWNKFVEDAVAPYAQDLQICSAIEQYSDDFWQANARNSEELSEKLQASQDQYEKCASKAKLRWESERPSDSVLAVAVLDYRLCPSGKPILPAFRRSAPIVRFIAFEILVTGVFAFE